MRYSDTLFVCCFIAMTLGKTIDQILMDNNIPKRLRKAGPILVDGDKAVLSELDIAEPLPCRVSGEISGNPCESEASGGRRKRNVAIAATKWGDGSSTVIVPYTYGATFSTTHKTNIEAAFAEYEKYTCIKMVPRDNEADYIDMVKAGGCWSYIGRLGGRQRISLDGNCAGHKRIVIHEFFHALGSWHQQSRPDRDAWVTVHTENIQSGKEHNFNKKLASTVNLHSTAYSYLSMMHYGKNFFSKNGQDTLTPNDLDYLNIIGRVPTFSFEDLQVANRHYECDQDCPSPNPCKPEQYRGKDCKCYCKVAGGVGGYPPLYPAEECEDEPDPDCEVIGTPCECTEEKCADLDNTVCSGTTKACECDAANGYELFQGECVDPSSETCDEANKPCYCTLKEPDACVDVPGSSCDEDSGECRCTGETAAAGDSCIVEECNKAGKVCGCSSKGAKACKKVKKSKCEENDACECIDNFENVNGKCKKIKPCKKPNRKCSCGAKEDPCIKINLSQCNSTSGACECLPFHKAKGKKCIVDPNCRPTEINDGSSVDPFTNTATNLFAENMGDEPTAQFGLIQNGHRLQASGTGSGQDAVMEVGQLTNSNSLEDITLCFLFNLKMTDGSFSLQYKDKDEPNWTSFVGFAQIGAGGWGTPQLEQLPVPGKVKDVEIRFVATSIGNSNWEVNVDPMIITNCDCIP